MRTILTDLISLPDEPIISDADELVLRKIVGITRTSEFEDFNLNDERLDSLTESLHQQEEFAKEIPGIVKGLDNAKSIIIVTEDEEDEDFI